MTRFLKLLHKLKIKETFQNSFYKEIITLKSKPQKTTQIKLQIDIYYEHIYRISQQNTCKSNLRTHQNISPLHIILKTMII